ncbi:MAG: PQQ-binding-like beta-propeller repeat protein [Actinomycetota bacterium]
MSRCEGRSRWATAAVLVAGLLPGCSTPLVADPPATRSPSSVSATPSPATSPSATYDWTTFGFDNKRSGIDPSEVLLDVDAAPTLQVSWSADLGGPVTAPPVVAGDVDVEGESTSLVFVGTAAGDFFALDASDGHVVWRRDVGSVGSDCEEFPDGAHGVTGSAVLDLAAGLVHVAGGTGKVFALDIATGAVADGWPVPVTREPELEHVFGALTLAGRLLYVTMAGVCDVPPFKGKVIAIDARTARRVAAFYPTGEDGPSGGGIWGAGGASVDPATGDVFVATGNAVADPEHFGFAEQVIRLSRRLKVRSANYPGVTGVDSDFGATPTLFRAPGCPPQLAAVNKDGELFIYRREAISEGPAQRLQISDAEVQQLQGVPAYSPDTGLLYVTNPSDSSDGAYRHGLLAFDVRPSCMIRLAWQKTVGRNNLIGSPPIVAGGVVYVAMAWDSRVYGFDSVTGQELWNSGDAIRGAVFAPPVVANGRLFQGSWDGHLYAFEPAE